MDRSNLGNRMKQYEAVPRVRLIRRLPVILRLDGKAFRTLTRGMEKPIDPRFVECMKFTAKNLCANIAGTQVAYVQSDEISLLLVDYQTLKTEPWLGYRVQKMCSIAASVATLAFNVAFGRNFDDEHKAGLFDCRAFNLGKDEVVNYFVWRQQDATRNSISGLAQANFSHEQLHGVNTAKMQDMLMTEKGINWNDLPTEQKRGFCVVKTGYALEGPEGAGKVMRSKWGPETEIPIFTKNRYYIQDYVDWGYERDKTS